ncbi:MAG: hypothetical protein ACMUJM_12615 [bacterium]
MTKLTIKLKENDYQRLKKVAESAGKSIQVFIYEKIIQLTDSKVEAFDITQDPVFTMEGYDSEAPEDLSSDLDKYLYGGKYPK